VTDLEKIWEIKFTKLDENTKAPTKGTGGAACYDLYSREEVIIGPHQTKAVGTGLCVEFHHHCELQIRPRSSLYKLGLIIPNSPGTVDSDYRGEIKVLLHNLSDVPVIIKIKDRIAQAKLSFVPCVSFIEVEKLDQTERGGGGFGSTGR
jgi:dUTP pyrophosphatase